MNIETLSTYKEKINTEIERQFSEYKLSLKKADELYLNLLEDMQAFIMRGGKRLRPYLLYLSYKGYGGMEDDRIISIGAALELLHNFLLIHDDIIDQDTVRYGGKNISGVYQDFFTTLGQAEASRNANNVAILAGDISHLMSSRIVAGSSIPSDMKVEVLNLIYEMTLLVAEGELVDSVLGSGLNTIETSEKRISLMYKNKTATYSFELPFRLGLILAKGGEKDIKIDLIAKFAESLGIAYQLQDDLLGIFGNSASTGKTDDGDIREGKKTLMHARALTLLKGDDLRAFMTLYGKKDAGADEIQHVRDLLESENIRHSMETLCTEYGMASLSMLKELGLSEEVEEIVKKLIESFKSRIS